MRADFLDKRLFGHLKNFNGLFAGSCRKSFEEIFQAITALEIIEKILDRHACTGKYGNAVTLSRLISITPVFMLSF